MQERTITTETIKDQIYEILKGRILDGSLKSGEQLTEQAIANQYNVSRSPVREAIMQLIGDGLAVNVSNRGTFVKHPTKEELREIQEMRSMIETFALQKIAKGVSREGYDKLVETKEQLLESIRRNDKKLFLDVERTLLITIVSMAENAYITESYTKLYCIIANFEKRVLRNMDAPLEESCRERINIIDALLEGDADKACSLCLNHSARVLEILSDALLEQEEQA